MTILRLPGITELPPAYAGMRIGLFGGSFNPPHEGHRLVALQVLKRLGLDAVWLLVSPGNPLKDHAELRPLAERVTAARAVMRHPAIRVTGFEAAHGFTYTYETLHFLKAAFPRVKFVWIMGADNLGQLHRWERWRHIANEVPIAVIDRPPQSFRALNAPAARALAHYRLPENEAGRLASQRPPAWVFLTGLKLNISSTGLRNPNGSWK